MEQNKELIPIFFSIDDRYAPYLAVALCSMLENASGDYCYKVIILHQGLSKDNRERLSSLGRDDWKIEFVEMGYGFESITNRMSNRLRSDYFTLTIYYRLFIPVMFPEYDKGIYLDSDIVVSGDISELYRVELEDNLIAACPDFSVQSVPELVRYIEYGVGVPRQKYINSGILLMNLKALRDADIGERFLTLLNKWHFDTIAPDQDYLNVLCHGRICYLDECWDAMPKQEGLPLENPKIIHYNLFSKTWCYDGIQYEEYFWKYAMRSGYLKEISDYKQSYTDEDRQDDAEHLVLLIHRGAAIARQSVNFRTVFTTGREERL